MLLQSLTPSPRGLHPHTAYFSVPSSALKKNFFQINFYQSIVTLQDFPGGSVVKNPPAKQETWVASLGQENPLEKGMATHSSILAWKNPMKEEPGKLQFLRSQRVG